MSPLAVVTGASSGLGRAIALELGRRGRSVVLLARDPARLEEARRATVEAGGSATIAAADVREPAALLRALDEACGDRPVGLVVHAAGILDLAPLDVLDEARVRLMLEVNVVGAVAVLRATLPRLEASAGRLVLVSSISGRLALPGGFTGYAASKWAVRGWAETARPELASRGIGLTIAYPSILDTAMLTELKGPDAPPVYRAFPWHPANRAARRILDDAAAGRRESYLTAGDRASAWAAAAVPRLFHAGLGLVIRLKGGTGGPT